MKKQVFAKRLLAILLAVMLIATSLVTITNVVTAAKSPALITNGDFSDGLNGWGVNHSNSASTELKLTTDTTVGSYVTGSTGDAIFQEVNLLAGCNYSVTFWTKLSGTTTENPDFYRAGFLKAQPNTTGAVLGGANFCDKTVITYTDSVMSKNANNYYSFYYYQNTDVTTWKQHTLTFTALTDATVYFVVGAFYKSGNPDFSVADVELSLCTDLIQNGNFSNQDLSMFSYHKNPTSIADPEVNNGILKASAGYSIFRKISLKANTSYTMSFDFRFKSNTVVSNYDSYYRAGIVTSIAAIGSAVFAIEKFDGSNKYYSIYSHQRTAPCDWKMHTITFTPTTDIDGYAVVGCYENLAGSDFELDNWSLYKTADLVTVTTVAENGGTVCGAVNALKGNLATLTATPDEGYVFAGWYNIEGTLLSTDATYQHLVTGNETLTAKFEIDPNVAVSNYLQNGDFEQSVSTDDIHPQSIQQNFAISQAHMSANSGKWGRIRSGVTVMKQTAVDATNGTEENGNYFLTSGATADGNYIRTFGQFVFLPVGEYALTYMSICDTANQIRAGIYTIGCEASQDSETKGYSINSEFIECTDEWNYQTICFTITEARYYMVAFGGNITASSSLTTSFSIDNVVLCKVMNTAMESKAAVRTAEASSTNKQGMRVYNRINQTYAAGATEYGSLAIRKGYLTSVQNALGTDEGLSLDLYNQFDAAYSGAPGFGRGISYNGTDCITYETTGTDYIFTAYLTGINPKNYGDTYLIRTYAKTNDDVLYGETFEVSIFDVVYTILEVYGDTSGEGYTAAMKMIEEAESTSGATTYAEWFAINHPNETSVVAE